eukprot:8401239-Lingulodinium_polyedra.AAC.1
MWGLPGTQVLPEGDSGEEEEEAAEQAAAQQVHQATQQVGQAAGSSSEAKQEDQGNKEVRRGEDILKSLRRKCKNSLFVAASILSRPELQTKTTLCLVFCSPLYEAHSQHAKDARAPEAVLSFYLQAALQAFLQPLR